MLRGILSLAGFLVKYLIGSVIIGIILAYLTLKICNSMQGNSAHGKTGAMVVLLVSIIFTPLFGLIAAIIFITLAKKSSDGKVDKFNKDFDKFDDEE